MRLCGQPDLVALALSELAVQERDARTETFLQALEELLRERDLRNEDEHLTLVGDDGFCELFVDQRFA